MHFCVACTVNQSKDFYLEIAWKNKPYFVIIMVPTFSKIALLVASQKIQKNLKKCKNSTKLLNIKNAMKYVRIICFLRDYLNESNIISCWRSKSGIFRMKFLNLVHCGMKVTAVNLSSVIKSNEIHKNWPWKKCITAQLLQIKSTKSLTIFLFSLHLQIAQQKLSRFKQSYFPTCKILLFSF